MAELVTMPKLSDTMEEGGISAWLKKEGEHVSSGEPLVSIETDKAAIEYASPEDGVLLKILAPAGSAVPIQAPIAVIGKAGEDFSALLSKKAAPPAPTSSQAPAAAVSTHLEESPAPTASLEKDLRDTRRIKVSPLAKKVAEAQGLVLKNIRGSGPQGRIILRDVQDAKTSTSLFSAAPLPPAAEDRKLPLSMMRKTIAKRLVQGKNEAPHFYLKVSASMEHLLQWRSQLNAAPGVKEGTLAKVSINDMLIFIVARALRRHPEINSSWQGDYILHHGQVNVAIAVALPQGLVTPVLTAADARPLREIAALSKSLVQKAHAGQLAAEDFNGGTFTISNLGMTLVEEFTAIINPPQAAILAVGAIREEVVVAAAGEFKAEKRLSLTLSCDHRVIDGLVGANFLGTVVGYLENPLMILA